LELVLVVDLARDKRQLSPVMVAVLAVVVLLIIKSSMPALLEQLRL